MNPNADDRPGGGGFSPAAIRDLRAAMRGGANVSCPACGAAMDVRAIPPRDDVSYVRRRAWLVCSSCGRSAVLDVEHRL